MRKKLWDRLLLGALAVCAAAFAAYLCVNWLGRDGEGPEISFQTEELQVSVSAGREELLAGVTAWDERDGDVTASLVLEGTSSISADGTVVATYAAFDQAGNVSKARRTLRYVDYESPRFTLSRPLIFRSSAYTDVMDYVGAVDAIDGSLDDRIKATLVGGEGSIAEVGLHEVEFRVTNSMGETIYLTAPVEVCPAGAYSDILALTEYLVYLERGAAFEAAAYLVNYQTYASSPEYTVEIQSAVDTGTPGTYSVVYTVRSDTFTGYSRLVVVVEE